MSKTPKREKRERRSRAEIEKLIAAYRGSGLTQVAFARERNLKVGTLRKWLGKERVMRGPAFREVRGSGRSGRGPGRGQSTYS